MTLPKTSRTHRLTCTMLVLAVIAVLSATATACNTELYRVTGRQHAYVWTCYDDSSMRKVVTARVSTAAPFGTDASRKRVERTNQCLQSAQASDARLRKCCEHRGEWERVAKPVLKRCIKASKQSVRQEDALKFSSNECYVGYEAMMMKDFSAFWTCKCMQGRAADGYYIVPGHLRFFVTGAFEAADADIFAVSECMRELGDELLHICAKQPLQFDELSVRLLRTCCKKVHGLLNGFKHSCSVLLPKAVDLYKHSVF